MQLGRNESCRASLADAAVDLLAQQVDVAHVAGVLLDHPDQHLAQRDRAAAAALLIRGILGDDRSGSLVIGLDPGMAGLG
jgi:hypothetical protein